VSVKLVRKRLFSNNSYRPKLKLKLKYFLNVSKEEKDEFYPQKKNYFFLTNFYIRAYISGITRTIRSLFIVELQIYTIDC